jgi:hypothetical protein
VRDLRSALVLVEPVFAPGGVLWHGMAFVAGENVNDITGTDRAVVLDDCWCSIDAAGVSVEPAHELESTSEGSQ